MCDIGRSAHNLSPLVVIVLKPHDNTFITSHLLVLLLRNH